VQFEKGTPAKKEDIEKCFSQKTPDAVFVNLASATDDFLTHCVKNIVEVMKEHGTSKIAYMSAWGVDDSFPSLNWIMKLMVPHTKLEKQFEDHKGAEQILKELEKNDIQWTVARPVMLKGGPAKETKELGDRGQEGQSFMPGITRASVAQFMVNSLFVENSKWIGRTPVISN
jgi:hypothetical protein